jgi:ATP-dependent Clp protease ATP-binding subunit ClpA
MWQRFTERARKVVFYAQEEAQKFGEGYVSTEHLLLGLTRESDSTAAQILAKLNVSLSEIRRHIEEQLPKGDARPSQDMTLTPRAKRVIDLAYDEARYLNHNYIGTEHLLLGLIREGDGLAGRVLAKLGVDVGPAHEALVGVLGEGAVMPDPPPRRTARDVAAPTTAWVALHARRQRMMADHLCLMFLFEMESNASKAVIGFGSHPQLVATLVEEEMLTVKTPEELEAGFLTATDILCLAVVEANNLGQDINGSHFLLAALVHGDNATARALGHQSIDYDKLKAWIADHP